jgi:hypothetical protein
MTQPMYYDPSQGVPPGYGQPQGYQPAPAYPPQQPAPYGYPGTHPGSYMAPIQPGQPGYAGQQYGANTPPAPQGAKGTLEDFYDQPSQGSGKGLIWKNAPNGYTYVGVVTRTPHDGDVFQDREPAQTGGKLKTFNDGRPKLVLPVQLRLAWQDALQQQNYPDQDARLFLRGGLRDEVSRAMAEAGETDVPKQGALVIVTLTHRKPGNNIATNMYAVQYFPAGTWEASPQFAAVAQMLAQPAPAQNVPAAPQQAPYQQQAPAQYAAPAQAYPNPQQYAQPGAQPYGGPAQQPQYGGQAYDPNQQAYPQAAQDQGTQQPQGQPVNPSQGQPQWQAAPQNQPVQANAAAGYPNPQAPVNPGPAPYQPAAQPQPYVQDQLPLSAPAGVPPQGQAPQPGVQPSGLTPEKQALLARVQGQQPGAPVQ